jgi:polysaccharide export outer membrane protein
MTRHVRRIAALLLALVPAPGLAQQPADSPTWSLRPGDVLRVSIWREQELSGDFPVDEHGVVTLPMLGPRQVTEKPFYEVEDSLIADYRQELKNPAINIAPLRRINVLGEVARPGLYLVDPTVSLAGAIAMAGGVTPQGDMRKIRVNRGGRVVRERIGAGSTLEAADVRSGDEILVLERSWLSRNSTFVISFLLSASSIVIALIQ